MESREVGDFVNVEGGTGGKLGSGIKLAEDLTKVGEDLITSQSSSNGGTALLSSKDASLFSVKSVNFLSYGNLTEVGIEEIVGGEIEE